MPKVISPLYSKGALFRPRPIWTPDPTTQKGKSLKKRKNRAAAPGFAEAMRRYKQKLKIGQQLKVALKRLRDNTNTVEALKAQLVNSMHPSDTLLLAIEQAQRAIAETEQEVEKWRAQLKMINGTNPDALDASAPFLLSDPQIISQGLPIAIVSLPPTDLGVPLPIERVRPDGSMYVTRDGQANFRAVILETYGRHAYPLSSGWRHLV